METGARIPADCVLIEGTDMRVDESIYTKCKPVEVKKEAATESNPYNSPDPFLLSDTLVTSGSGKAVVCCVGAKSRRGVSAEKLDTTSKTPLQQKLENLGAIFTKWGLYGAIFILIANLVNFIIKVTAIEEYQNAKYIIDHIAEMFTLSITIIIVAVPEGLPLAITLSLAYSVMRMRSDGVLVRNLNAPEVMGRVDEICTGKTGTLTKSEMKVDQFYS